MTLAPIATDNLAEVLQTIVTPLPISKELQQTLLEQLVMYVVERDHKIRTAAYEAGRASA